METPLDDRVWLLMIDRQKGLRQKPKGIFVKRCPLCNTRLKGITRYYEGSLDQGHISYYKYCPKCNYEWGSRNGQ